MVRSNSSLPTASENAPNTQASSSFTVEVRYREPSYESRHGARAEPYRFRYRLEAPNEQAAVAFVVAEFKRMNMLSSVGWTRLIVDIVVEPVLSGADRIAVTSCDGFTECVTIDS